MQTTRLALQRAEITDRGYNTDSATTDRWSLVN
jgi:hypothetical protein